MDTSRKTASFQPLDECYVVNAIWSSKWRNHSIGKTPPPGPVDNRCLLDESLSELKPGLIVNQHFIIVHQNIWKNFHTTYGSDYAIHFKVPIGHRKEMYEDGSWMTHVDFYKLSYQIGGGSSTRTSKSSQQSVHDINANKSGIGMLLIRPRVVNMALREIPVLSTKPSHPEIQIVGHEVCREEKNRAVILYATYVIHVITTHNINQPWIATRRFKEFSLLDSAVRKFKRSTKEKLSIPYFPPRRLLGSSMKPRYIETRRQKLELYLQKLGAQQNIWNCPEFLRFLKYEYYVKDSAPVNPLSHSEPIPIVGNEPTTEAKRSFTATAAVRSSSKDKTSSSNTAHVSPLSIPSTDLQLLEAILEYPPHSPRSNVKAGVYYNNLSIENSKLLQEIKTRIRQQNINIHLLNRYAPNEDFTILRYLRVNGMDVDKALAHITRNIVYRNDIDFVNLVSRTPDSILGIPLQKLRQYYQHWQFGYDKCGSPIIYYLYSTFDASAMKKIVSYDKVLQYRLWEHEANARVCQEESRRLGKIVDATTVVVDCKGMKITKVNSDFINLMQSLGNLESAQYPEPYGHLFIINGPTGFSSVWNMMKGLIDPVTAKSIHVLGGPKDWTPKLFDFIGEENMPSTYGGRLPALSPQRHPYADYMNLIHPEKGMDHWTSGKWAE